MKNRYLSVNFHQRVKILLVSKVPSYLEYFKKELPSGYWSEEAVDDPDVTVFIGFGIPSKSPGDITDVYHFKNVYTYTCVLRGMNRDGTKVYFQPPLWGRFLPFELDAVFFHNQIFDSLLYYKMVCKGLLMFHAGAVSRGKEVYLFTGVSGTGKTSLAFKYVDKGYEFLGDDVIFISGEGEVLAYPKRVHYFSYLKDKNPFLKISTGIAVSSALRQISRSILKKITGQNFYLSTRVPVGDLIPGASCRQEGYMSRVFLIGGGSHLNFYKILFSCDSRDYLFKVLLKEHPEIRKYIEQQENKILDGKLKVVDVMSVEKYEDVKLSGEVKV